MGFNQGFVSTFSSEFYMKHKEYFDNRLILLLEKNTEKITSLNEKVDIYKASAMRDKAYIKEVDLKNRDLKIVCDNLEYKLKNQKEETAEIIKDFEKQINEMDKTINGDLNDAYKRNNDLLEELRKLKEENHKLKRENNKYKRFSKTNSTNSSIPPSKDESKKISNSRKKSDLEKGGQPGHPAHRSPISKSPNKVIYKTVAKAPIGAVAVYNEQKAIVYYKTQEINAYLKTKIIETRYLVSEKAPELSDKEMKTYKINSVSYHNDFKSMILYLNSKGTIALQRLCTMINEMSKNQIDIKPSTVVNWSKELHKKSAAYTETVIAALMKEKVLYVDETGWKINGKQHWMHVIASDRYAYFVVTKKRGDKEEGPLKILEYYRGFLVHDHFKPYYNLKFCQHVECNAHILRYLRSGAELDKNEACKEMIKLMQDMIHQKKELTKQGIYRMEEDVIRNYEEQYHKILKDELERYDKANPKKPKAKYIPDYIKLMKRMEEYSEEHLRFIKSFLVPADNNLAERQMRPTKAKKKISGQSLNLETANDFAAIHTVNQTCSLQGKNTLEEIKAILNCEDDLFFSNVGE